MNEFEMTLKALNDNDYDYSEYEVKRIIAQSKEAKSELISKLRQMPNWNEDAQAVVFRKNIKRNIDTKACYEVLDWVKKQLKLQAEEVKIAGFTHSEVVNYTDSLADKIGLYKQMIRYGEPCDKERFQILNADFDRFKFYLSRFEKETFQINNPTGGYKRVTREAHGKIGDFFTVADLIMAQLQQNENLLSDEVADIINRRFPVNAVAGQKISRILGKICKYLKLDQIKDIQVTFNGSEKDYGYNYMFAKFGDSCNPFEVNRYVILSVNFCDFLYMSNGDSWASCHTIINGGAGGYNGEYSSGTVSYALDNDSFIFYTVDKDYDGNDFALQPKMQRVVFAYRDGVLYEGRVYPDGRDGGDQGYAAQFRNLVQELFAKVEEKNNLWTKVSSKMRYINSLGGTAYHDWLHYSDTNVTILKEIVDDDSKTMVHINVRPRCLQCGSTHSVEESIICCGNGRCICDECGGSFDEDDSEAIWINDLRFCCERCARRAGYVWCDDIDEYVHQDEAHRDNYTGDWFYRDYDMVYTENGNEYANWDNAEADGYRCAHNGNWYPLDELFFDEYDSEYYLKEDYDTIYNFNGRHYISLANAEANGEDISEYIEEEVA